MRSSSTRITRARDRRSHFDREGFAIALVDDVEGPKVAAVVEGIGHEIERPRLVEPRRRDKRLAEACREASLRAPRQIESERTVHAVYAFVIPPVPREVTSESV